MAGMRDRFPSTKTALLGPYLRWATITPGSSDLLERPRAIHNPGAAGTITMTDEDGTSVAIYFLQGQTLPCRPIKVTAAAAGGVVAFY